MMMLGSLVAMVYGPLAAALAEMFPARIRYSATGLAYHLGNGWFGGLLPTVAFALVVHRGSMFAGLVYPITIAALSFLVSLCWLPESRGRDVRA